MSATGPELPPHLLAKRKRQREESEQDGGDRPPGAKRSKSPEVEKRTRVMGPAPPPAPLEERPSAPANRTQRAHERVEDDATSDDDDDFGPALPKDSESGTNEQEEVFAMPADTQPDEPKRAATSQRDEWMMIPPTQDDLAARMDPSKLRARGFNTGKSAKAPIGGGGIDTMWTETPEQKRKRLADEVMGVKPTASSGAPPTDARAETKRAEDRAIAARVQEQRNKSLYDEHQQTHDKEKEDDPSKRAFDREKDIGSGMKISETQRREMLNKAKSFSSKFSGGSYL